MLHLFYRKKNKRTKELRPLPFAGSIKSYFKTMALRLAARLSKIEQGMSLTKRKVIISIFCMSMIMIFFHQLYDGLFSPQKVPNFIRNSKLTRPVVPHLPDSVLFHQYERSKFKSEHSPITTDSNTSKK